ncbi:MAG: aminotransferase class I/II-fold pyridoxal phosphate-dependent enzyme, partial [Actinomycetia bacterium]|nr:aminotransferase class I/II-fold pyridoxal phosphate-dependent enzyme [Actinomycetes bacterium]
YPGHQHIPIASLPGMWERTITIGSAGKSFSFTGWKVGWGTGPADLIAAVRTVRQHLSYVSSGPFQWAIADALESANQDPENEYFTQFRAQLKLRRDLFSDGLRGLGFSFLPSQGSYFVTTDVRPVGFASGGDFCDALPERAGLVAIPEVALSDHPEISSPYVRWAFCKQPAVLQTALDRLAALVG